MELVLFYIFGAVAVGAAIVVVTARSPLHGALSLIGSFFALAAIYVLLGAHLLAALQILVYAGAVMVLFIFVIMLLNLKDDELGVRRVTPMKVVGAAGLGVAGLALIVRVLMALGRNGAPVADHIAEPGFGTVAGVARVVYGNFLLPFELTGVLLLVAVVAAIVVAKARI